LWLASLKHKCSWDVTWMGSQEEAIERRSAVYRLGLDPTLNLVLDKLLREKNGGALPTHHVPRFGVVYHSGVPIIRNSQWKLMGDFVKVDIVAAGAIDLRFIQYLRDRERSEYIASTWNPFGGLDVEKFSEHTKMKIRMVLLCATVTGHKNIILGAFGCGAFKNPIPMMAKLFKEVLQEEEFCHKFENVVFAVLGKEAYNTFKNVIMASTE